MTSLITLTALGTSSLLGVSAGPNADGVLIGQITGAAAYKALLNTIKQPCLCVTDDGGSYVNETTGANETTADDVEIVGATLAAEDAIYFGHATKKFSSLSIEMGVAGVYTTTTWAWEYWDGDGWTALAAISDGTSGFTSAVDTVAAVTYTLPTDWDITNVPLAGAGYWVRARCTATAGTTTAAELDQAWVHCTGTNAVFTDDTTDFNDAGAGDVALLGATTKDSTVGDAFYVGHATQKFSKVKVTTSQALTGTVTLVIQYWDGSAWTAIPAPVSDSSAGWTATAGAHVISFNPPSDWAATTAANGPGAFVGYFIRVAITALTSVTQQPVATIGSVLPVNTGATGIRMAEAGTIQRIDMYASTLSGTTADSVFSLLNATSQESVRFTWTKATATDQASVSLPVEVDDELVLMQLIGDGTTEFGGSTFVLRLAN